MPLRRWAFPFLILFILFGSLLPAQDKPRPRIGLALSGGGARGLAHIGVLRWMDEHRIPVDYVAGTSMGALAGATYATGMNAVERQGFVDSINWQKGFLTEPDYGQLSFRRKEDRRSHEVTARLGLKHGIGSPNGFSPGHEAGLLLDRLTFPYSNLASFDDLPIPFRCVATDMLSGSAVVEHDGSLAQALRATMALPGIFSPVELNHTILADGGLVNNIPTDVARDMGAEVVIAVNVVAPLGNAEQLQSLQGVLWQSISIMTLDNDRRALKNANVVITPDLGGYSLLDFAPGRVKDIVQRGYDAAARSANELLPYALTEQQWKEYTAAIAARKRPTPASVTAVEVAESGPLERAHLEKELQPFVNQRLDTSQLEKRLTQIAGEGKFDRLGYEGFLRNDAPALRIWAHEKSYGPPFLDLALNVSGAGVGTFDFAAGVRVTFMDVKHHGGEWRNDLLLGSSSRAATELYQPLGTSHVFVAPYLFFDKVARNTFAGDQRIGVLRDERGGGGLDFGLAAGRHSELRAGYQIFNADVAPLIGSSDLPLLDGSSGKVRLRYVFDGLDSATVPGKGERLTLDLSRVFQSPGAAHAFNQVELRSSTFIPWSDRNSLFLNLAGGATLGGDAGELQLFSLGGQFRLGAYLPDQFRANHYAYSALGFRRDFYRLPALIGKKVYWGGWLEAGTAFNDPGAVVVRGTFNLGVVAETIVGPVALSGSVSPTGQTRVNFSIGRVF
jgi:NTE family protein